jgi:hypothetical protein
MDHVRVESPGIIGCWGLKALIRFSESRCSSILGNT